jgi:predicted Zn-dependent protease
MDLISVAAVSSFLLSLGEKALISAIVKIKENADREKGAELDKLIGEVVANKSLSRRIQERITVSLQSRTLPKALHEAIRALDGDEVLGLELARSYLTSSEVEGEFVRLLIVANPSLSVHAADLRNLASIWIEAVDFAVASEPQLEGILSIRGFREQKAGIREIQERLAQTEVRLEESRVQGIEELKSYFDARLSDLSAPALRIAEAEAASVKSIITSQYQRRFDVAREELINGSIQDAARSFRSLIDDMEEAADFSDVDLKLRAYLNLSTCYLEKEQTDDARQALESARRLGSTDLRVKRNLAAFLGRTGNAEAALQLIRELQLAEPDKAAHRRDEASLLLDLGQVKDAVSVLQAHPEDDVDYWTQLALALQRNGLEEDAVAAARRARGLDLQSEGALMALSYTLGFPIVRRRDQTRFLTADRNELVHLREAIAAAESAERILRSRGRTQILRELLTNLIAFYAMAGETQKAANSAVAILELGDRSPMAIKNAYYALMRDGRYDLALEAAGFLRKNNLYADESRRLEVHALLALKRFGDVLSIRWGDETSLDENAKNLDRIYLTAEALIGSFKGDEAEKLLNCEIPRWPDAGLFLIRAKLYARIGKSDLARGDFIEAEQLAGRPSQASLDFGYYLYSKGEWQAAADRFEELGGESPASPLHQQFLICIFNAGHHARCLALSEEWINGGFEFDETVYALAARCYQISEDVPAARSVLECLVKEKANLAHRKMLGSVYLRLDELNLAYNILGNVVAEDGSDVESLLLLSAVCAGLGKGSEALERAYKATIVAPEDVQARAAFFGAMLTLPDFQTAPGEIVAAHEANFKQLVEHPSGVLRAVSLEDDLKDFRGILSERERQVGELDRMYRGANIPLAFLAKQSGTPIFELWRNAIRISELGIRMSVGSQQEQESEFQLAKQEGSVSLELTALFAFHGLGFIQVLPKLFPRIYAHVSLLDEIVVHLRQSEISPPNGKFSSVKGQIVHSPLDSADFERMKQDLRELRDFLKGPNVTLVGISLDCPREDRRMAAEGACGRAAILPIFVARERSAPLLSDDLILRGIARLEEKIDGFCTQTALRVALERRLISPDEYDDAVFQLWDWNYKFVSERAETMVRAFSRANGRVSDSIERLLRRVERKECEIVSAVPILAGFLAFAWLNGNAEGDRRETWARIVWESFLRADPPQMQIVRFVAELAKRFAFFPDAFLGLVGWAIRSVPEVARFADVILKSVRGISESFEALFSENGIVGSAICTKWKELRFCLLDFQKMGWLVPCEIPRGRDQKTKRR